MPTLSPFRTRHFPHLRLVCFFFTFTHFLVLCLLGHRRLCQVNVLKHQSWVTEVSRVKRPLMKCNRVFYVSGIKWPSEESDPRMPIIFLGSWAAATRHYLSRVGLPTRIATFHSRCPRRFLLGERIEIATLRDAPGRAAMGRDMTRTCVQFEL